jgi:DNA mismatch repair ATPase MutS
MSNPIITDLYSTYAVFKEYGGGLSTIGQERLDTLESIMDYIRIIFLISIRQYNRTIQAIEDNNEAFQRLYCSIGAIDLAIATLSVRASLPHTVAPCFVEKNCLEVKNVYHPLIDEPVCATTFLGRGHRANLLISGSNASGKSTFIKALAVNVILAQSLHTCCASSFASRFFHVVTSMGVRDDITSGESYFIVEVRSLKRILDLIDEVPCLCVIDEILRGTNTLERIAASTAVLRYINTQDCLCIVATHDRELTENLNDDYRNCHFSEHITANGMEFDYQIKDGPADTRNALALLEHFGFEESIVADARRLS